MSDSTATARRPTLAIKREGDKLLLTISGDVGRAHEIERATTIKPPDWGKILSITLTTDPQVVEVPVPSISPAFFRAKVP